MSRNSFVSCFFAVPMGLMTLLLATAQPPATVNSEAGEEVRLRIESALDELISIEFMDVELADVCAYISEVSNIPILIDQQALNDVGLSPEEPISLTISGISTRAMLKHVLRPLDLTWMIQDEVLLITTPEKVEDTLVTKIYRVHDLVAFVDEEGGEVYEFDSLIELITTTIEPTSWDEIGGPGSITGYQATGMDVLVISQIDPIHREVGQLLETLNNVRPDEAMENGPRLNPQENGSADNPFAGGGGFGAGGGGGGGGGFGAGGGGGGFAGGGGFSLSKALPAGTPGIGLRFAAEGEGPGEGGDQYDHLPENSFEQVSINPLSTFSIDVDTASYSKMRMYLTQQGQLPPAGAIRLEELINYFRYEYPEPAGEHPVATHVEVASCPWQPDHRLVRVGVQARHIDLTERPPCNLVFLLDVSGSMNQANKLPLVKAGLERFVRQLRADDRVAIVVYAGSSGLVLPSTSGEEQDEILASLEKLSAGGSTNGGEGISLAYRTIRENFIEEGVNRILLCSDGDFNVGVTSTDALVELAAEQAKDGIYLSVLGFGMGNHNDAMLETLSNNAEGNYAFIDTLQEANKVLVEQMSGTLITVARDVKIQIEFNPTLVRSYRLIGYENRMLAEEDFKDDEVDAGEIGAGHTVTALYEVVPMGIDDTVDTPEVAPFRYQRPAEPTEEASSGELLTVNLRYKLPDAEESTLIDLHVSDDDRFFNQATAEFQFAAAVAEFGLLLRDSQHAGDANYAEILELATDNVGPDEFGYRTEFVELVRLAANLAEQQASTEEE